MANARILVIDDEELMREFVVELLERGGYRVDFASNGADGIALVEAHSYDMVVTDLKMVPMDGLEVVKQVRTLSPTTRVIVMTAYGTVDTAVAAMKEGADDYILKPFSPEELELGVERSLAQCRMIAENQYLRSESNAQYNFDSMIGLSDAMHVMYGQIEKVAQSKSTVFIRGESGTGKELVARAVHYTGPRADKPFIKVNCAALSAGLLESELFGHEKGAFTGAHDRKIGRFELADGGTLLLDEVSEMSMELQPKLLRALQEREIDRVGGNDPISVDTRIIATSNRDLEKEVADGNFREDLFFRLNVIPLQLPPLRDRREDVPKLVEHYVDHYATENGRGKMKVAADAMKRLCAYQWPGNVRELQNSVERAVVLSDAAELRASDFALLDAGIGMGSDSGGLRAGMTVAQAERALIFVTLEACSDNKTQAAGMLDISVRTLRNKLKEYEEG